MSTQEEKLRKTWINGERYLVHELEDPVLSKDQFCPNWPTESIQFQSKSQQNFLAEIDKMILKFIQKCKGLRLTKTTSK